MVAGAGLPHVDRTSSHVPLGRPNRAAVSRDSSADVIDWGISERRTTIRSFGLLETQAGRTDLPGVQNSEGSRVEGALSVPAP